MAEWATKRANRRRQVRQQRTKAVGVWYKDVARSLLSWPVLTGVLFVLGACAAALLGEDSLRYSIGQHIDRPVAARIDFQVLNPEQTSADRRAAKAKTPSYYAVNAPALTYGRIRANLKNLYQAAMNAEKFEDYAKTLTELGWPAEDEAYQYLRTLAGEAGREQFSKRIDALPLEAEYIVRDRLREDRDPASATDFIRLELQPEQKDEPSRIVEVPHNRLVPFENEQARRGSAATVARKFGRRALLTTIEAIVMAAFNEQPTIVFAQEQTIEKMREAQEATPIARTMYERDKVLVQEGILGVEGERLLRAEHDAYHAFLGQRSLEADLERRTRWLQRTGVSFMVVIVSIGLLVHAGLHQPRIYSSMTRTAGFLLLVLAMLVGSRMLELRWPTYPELLFFPCMVAGSVFAIVYPRRFSIGAIAIASLLVATVVRGDLVFLLTLLTGVVVMAYQLDEIRTRTKFILTGVVTALSITVASIAGGLWHGHEFSYVGEHALWAGVGALAVAFLVSGTLPLIEHAFRSATSLTLLEWRDPTRELLQLLARDAPGTYNHSLVLGTLAEAACDRIGANGLLAQVGALYHDIGKIHKAEYFAENQTGKFNLHENLAPTMSLLIILGHVKDGIEMAREYKLPRVLHQFIEEHHGTTVVRYFHHLAAEKQPLVASGKHDREVPEAEFRYSGPKPRARESAVLMLCDGVEGAVRALQDPTPSRIEGIVHQIVMDRLNDGQFDDCEITLRQIHQVEESLVKSLCGIYHGRVAYPKASKPESNEHAEPKRMSV